MDYVLCMTTNPPGADLAWKTFFILTILKQTPHSWVEFRLISGPLHAQHIKLPKISLFKASSSHSIMYAMNFIFHSLVYYFPFDENSLVCGIILPFQKTFLFWMTIWNNVFSCVDHFAVMLDKKFWMLFLILYVDLFSISKLSSYT